MKLIRIANNDVVSVFITKFKYIAIDPESKPATSPSTVLFGEMFSINFLFPYRRPIS